MKTKTLIVASMAAGTAAGTYYLAKKNGPIPTNKEIANGIEKVKSKLEGAKKQAMSDGPI